ncbi:MAG: NTP transferase domain-containing protein, partial [Deltaproteobacteria bacterium]|nr:NTP transferase domain-containing protein [Deltaproteobacteria bacterium]
MLERPELGAVILAAGDSTRFQPGPKALPPPRGADLLARSVAALALAGLERPTVVANPGQPAVIRLAGDLGCRVIVNPDPGRGMFSSVRLAFAGAGGESVLVLPVDAGLVSADSILSVAARFMELGWEGRGLAVLPAQGGRLGHPPAIGRDLLGTLASYGGPGGLRGAMAGLAGSREEAGAVLGARLPAAGQAGQGSRLRFLSLDDPMV